jgi:predicted metal-dependent peptidase
VSAAIVALDQRKLVAARTWAASRFPYLASALFAAAVTAQPECRTIAVDRTWHIHVDPTVLEALDVEEVGKVLVHLSGHLLREHALRAETLRVEGDEGRAQWNRAADAEINDDLAGDGAVPTVAPDVPASLGCEDHQLAESYYARGRSGPRHWDCGSGCDNGDRSWDASGGIDREQSQLLRLGVAADIQRRAHQEPGTIPGGWRRWAESVLPSRVDWRRVLAAEIRNGIANAAGKVDYTYRRPARRASVTPDVVLPSLYRPLPNVAVVCDTSGSMHEALLTRALAEVEGLLVRGGLRQAQVRVLAVDTNVHAVRRVTSARQVELAGGGGTDMGVGIAAAAGLRPKPSVIVVLTDGFTPWPAQAPKGVRVVIGLLTQHEGMSLSRFPAPGWARVVAIAG